MDGGLLKGVLVWAFLTSGMVATEKAFECDNFNPDICTLDSMMFCLTNGTVISGRCHAQRAVCLEARTMDSTFAACTDGSEFDCDAYRANPLVCTKDLIPYCLDNATVIHGTCAAKQAVCTENRQVDDHFSTCNEAAVPSSNDEHVHDEEHTHDDDDEDDHNSAVALTATVSLLLGLFLSTLF
eukprot:TRINITY_DN30963_c0_g1_i2.p1 TRINITY_DN30963_c0_g1~~TRINITY_DN30963_c0_g1_i2.p1  ORF type:complete len:183 (+),score=38.79 TRINITY_DN30963_c0_g1_i2:150-698(+)